MIRTLVIEDDAHSLAVITQLLREAEIEFKRNTTGAHVLEQVRAMPQRPDLILLDLTLPHADPFWIRSALALDWCGRNIPVAAMSESLDAVSACRQAGFDGFLVKPLARQGLSSTLQRLAAGEKVYPSVVRCR